MSDIGRGQEYQTFLESNVNPPDEISRAIFKVVHRDLKPAPVKVFAKAALIHVAMGTVSIFGCPQFGLTPTGKIGIMQYLNRFGDAICAFGCGAFFIFGTVIMMGLLLRAEELKILRKTELYQLGALLLMSLGAFHLSGASLTLSWSIFWLIGALFVGALGIEFLFRLRRRAVLRV